MYSHSPQSAPDPHQSLLRWQRVYEWAHKKGRHREFLKDETLSTRSGILYCVHHGIVRLNGSHMAANQEMEESCLGFVGAGQPFELHHHAVVNFKAIAHLDGTEIFWLYWQDLDIFPGFSQDVLSAMRHQNQRRLLWLHNQRQLRARDRLLGYLCLMTEDFGEVNHQGRLMSFPLTHNQIADSIGTTRVTVTKILKELRQKGLIHISADHHITLHNEAFNKCQQHLRLIE